MAEITMPKMGDAMEEGTLLEWLKKEGDPIEEQEPIATIETEKSTIEIPSFYSGQVSRILVEPGATVPVGTPIALIDTGDGGAQTAEAPAAEAVTAQNAATGRNAAPRGETRPSSQPSAPTRQAASARAGEGPAGRVKASPLARKVAATRGVDLSRVRGTGPGGRIVEADVEEFVRSQGTAPPQVEPPRALPSAPSVAPQREAPAPVEPAAVRAPAPMPAAAAVNGAYTERELSGIRRTIARRLVESKQQIPHYYVTAAIDVGPVARLRDQVNALRGDQPKVSYNDFIVRACALALRDFPTVNAQFTDGKLRSFESAHVGVAVALDEGLIVPVVRNADGKSLSQISDEVRALVERAKAGQLKPEEYSGGTFTISNLGMFDVEDFVGIINPPEVALLAVGAIQEQPVVKDGQVTAGLRMRITLSSDHRIVDGAVAAQFLQAVKRLLQEPLRLI
jgi:pyruvate dehydrogenase E2 component (dihydrolipoamide acetyltransferase)